MTFATTCIGLFPVMWATGTGSDVMKRIAAPMVGGIFTSFILELLVYPSIYELWRWNTVADKLESRAPDYLEKSATGLKLITQSAVEHPTGD